MHHRGDHRRGAADERAASPSAAPSRGSSSTSRCSPCRSRSSAPASTTWSRTRDFYFGEGANPLSALFIWEGGIAIYGALIGGAIGAWLGCRWTGIRFWTFADALAPGLLLAQAIGRFGNWFNQELFGLPTDLPWGLEIDSDNPAFPPGSPTGTLFHPTFLYEVIWNALGVLVLLWAGRRFRLQWGRLFAPLPRSGTARDASCGSRSASTRARSILGLRTNVWAAIFGVVLGIVIFFVQKRRHPGLEPSPYVPGREWKPEGAVQSQNTDDFVDVSEPPTSEAVEAPPQAQSPTEVTLLHAPCILRARADVVPF